MQRLQKTVLLTLVVAAPAAAQVYFKPQRPCFTDGASTYQVTAAAAPDYRVRVDNGATRPDLRLRLVDRPEAADFVLVDDPDTGNASACRGAASIKTIAIDNRAPLPDVTVTLQGDSSDYGLYVHSVRFSHEDAAALFAVMWKASHGRDLLAHR